MHRNLPPGSAREMKTPHISGGHSMTMGQTQMGKSTKREVEMLELARSGAGFLLIDWHGNSYRAMLRYLSANPPRNRVIALDCSAADPIVPWDFFRLKEGADPEAHAAAMTERALKPWDTESSDAMPTYAKQMGMLQTYMARTGDPLHLAAKMLWFRNREFRESMIKTIESDSERNDWDELNQIRTLKEWESHTLSTGNRIRRLISSRAFRRFTGLKLPSLDISECIGESAIILMNVQRSKDLDVVAAKTFASCATGEALDAAIANASKRRHYAVFCDEAQEYLTDADGELLDGALKSGLHVNLTFHHLGQFDDRPKLRAALEINCQTMDIFGGLPYGEASRLAERVFIHEINERREKEVFHSHQTTGFREVDHFTETDVEGESDGDNWNLTEAAEWMQSGQGGSTGTTRSRSVTRSTRLEPIIEKFRSGVSEWSREEKVSVAAEGLMLQRIGEYVHYDGRNAERMRVSLPKSPFPEWTLISSRYLLRFMDKVRQGSITGAEADRILAANETEFNSKAKRNGTRPRTGTKAIEARDVPADF